MNISSFTSASVFPAKILSSDIVEQVSIHRIRPMHVQFNPTNKCPLSCSFCSCANRERGDEMLLEEFFPMARKFASMGTKAVTITGGGDPLAHTGLKTMLQEFGIHRMSSGLVTNAVLIKDLSYAYLEHLTWCRVSVSSEYNILTPTLSSYIKSTPHVDWSLSYVLANQTTQGDLIKAIEFTNTHQMTHIRVVEDILNPENSMIDYFRDVLFPKIDCSRVIWQGRKTYGHGHRRCLLSLIKPNIAPDGKIFPCCGVQYSREHTSLSFDSSMMMGDIYNISDIWDNQKFFDGSTCTRCYYTEYNTLLNLIWDYKTLDHKEFV